MNLVKKITMKDVQLGKAKLQAMNLSDEIPIMNVAGIANEIKTGTSTYGEWTAAIGQFWAKNLITSEEYVSRAVILPPLAQDLITDSLKAGGSVEFAYTITAIPDSSREVNGLKYGVRPVTPVRERDDVHQLRSLFGTNTEQPPLAAAAVPQIAAAMSEEEHAQAGAIPIRTAGRGNAGKSKRKSA